MHPACGAGGGRRRRSSIDRRDSPNWAAEGSGGRRRRRRDSPPMEGAERRRATINSVKTKLRAATGPATERRRQRRNSPPMGRGGAGGGGGAAADEKKQLKRADTMYVPGTSKRGADDADTDGKGTGTEKKLERKNTMMVKPAKPTKPTKPSKKLNRKKSFWEQMEEEKKKEEEDEEGEDMDWKKFGYAKPKKADPLDDDNKRKMMLRVLLKSGLSEGGGKQTKTWDKVKARIAKKRVQNSPLLEKTESNNELLKMARVVQEKAKERRKAARRNL